MSTYYFNSCKNIAVSVGATTTVALAENANRKYLTLVNDSDEVIYYAFGAAAVLNSGGRLNAAGGVIEMKITDNVMYTGAINAICASGSKVLGIIEG